MLLPFLKLHFLPASIMHRKILNCHIKLLVDNLIINWLSMIIDLNYYLINPFIN